MRGSASPSATKAESFGLSPVGGVLLSDLPVSAAVSRYLLYAYIKELHLSQLTVAKFGGTSVADAGAMSRCAAILEQNPDTRLAVLSASSGVTNLLVALASGEQQPEARAALLQQLTDIQQGILNSLDKPDMLTRHIEDIIVHIKELSDSAAISPISRSSTL